MVYGMVSENGVSDIFAEISLRIVVMLLSHDVSPPSIEHLFVSVSFLYS